MSRMAAIRPIFVPLTLIASKETREVQEDVNEYIYIYIYIYIYLTTCTPDDAFRAGLRKLGPKNKIPEVFLTKKAKIYIYMYT